MKKVLLIVFCFASLQAISQRNDLWWFDAGVKAQYGITGLFNTAVWDSDNYDYEISKGYSYAAKLGINYGYSGIALELGISQGEQEFQNIASSENNLTANWKTFDLYTLYRTSKNLGYFEIGPKTSLLSEMNVNNVNRDDEYNKLGIAGVMGFGAYVIGSDGAFSGILGLRFEYGILDMVKDGGLTTLAPVDDPSIYASNGYKGTRPFFVGLVFELNWGLGYFGQARCGERSKFIRF